MKFIADFHIHSHFSIATSRNLTPEHIEYWARIKGINVVGTGDCVHPGWLRELREKLEPADNGLYRLKDEFRLRESKELGEASIPGEIYFILTGEISNIYKKDGKVRKVHNICVFPDFDSVVNLQTHLDAIGNITSDGRPILGLDSKILLEKTLESGEGSFLIPAHIWTPWFSVLGSKSGFDTIEECYEDLTGEIFALETGLSTDPAMNRTCSFLDDFKLVSNSDAHSPEKLGREANLFDCELSYRGIYEALKGENGFDGTIEFFPQEGKYHYDGHRKCGICWDPLETVHHGGRCPVCGKPVTLGVMYRIAELADRKDPQEAHHLRNFYSITQLPDLIAEIRGVKSPRSKAVQRDFFQLIRTLGQEFFILLFADINDISAASDELIAEGICRLRDGRVIIDEGYDGEFGRVRVFNQEELENHKEGNLFSFDDASIALTLGENITRYETSVKFDIDEFKKLVNSSKLETLCEEERANLTVSYNFSKEQNAAITHQKGPSMVIAGPGTGKTRVLTERIAWLIEKKEQAPEKILAITFSNRAAKEMKERVCSRLSPPWPEVRTFHAFGLEVLKHHYRHFHRDSDFHVIDREETEKILEGLVDKKNIVTSSAAMIESVKQGQDLPPEDQHLYERYNEKLKEKNAFDLSDLVYLPVLLLEEDPDLAALYRESYTSILVDEYQDINGIQYRFLKAITDVKKPDLFLIGDPAQAIYGFRGSSLSYLDKIKDDFPGIKKYNLSRSYRCPETILQAGLQVIAAKKKLGGTEKGEQVTINKMETDRSEADWIAATIEEMLGGVRSYSMHTGISDGEARSDDHGFGDFAVLCRSSFMFEAIIEAMNNHGIPCQVVGTAPFYRKEPFAATIKLFKDIFYHIGDHSYDEEETRVSKMIEEGYNIESILDEILREKGADEEDRKKIGNFSLPFKDDYHNFFQMISLQQGIDDFEVKADAVSLMTIHASKGLEFQNVFIPGIENNILPFQLFGALSPPELQEEERLLYVGMTRAAGELFLSYAGKRMYRGRVLRQNKSSFLDKIEKELYRFSEQESRSKESEKQLDLFS